MKIIILLTPIIILTVLLVRKILREVESQRLTNEYERKHYERIKDMCENKTIKVELGESKVRLNRNGEIERKGNVYVLRSSLTPSTGLRMKVLVSGGTFEIVELDNVSHSNLNSSPIDLNDISRYLNEDGIERVKMMIDKCKELASNNYTSLVIN